jgi:hypothetical protein
MGMFANQIAGAKPTEGSGLFFLPGLYPVVQLKQLKMFDSKNPSRAGSEMLIINCDILESRVDERPPGTQDCAQVLNSSHPGAKDDAKRFFLALGIPEESIDENLVKLLTSVEQPAAGYLLSLECYDKVSSKTGKHFTKHVWRPVAGITQDQADDLRAKAGLPPFRKPGEQKAAS